MMIYITGDTHGKFDRYISFTAKFEPTPDDIMIVLGDAGINYYGDHHDADRKRYVNSYPFTTFCIHGNHEMRPFVIPSYKTKEFCGGLVWYEEEYPNIVFAKDGEIYKFGDLSCIVIGGAYSVDKYYRLANGWNWFSNEQPSEGIRNYVENKLTELGNKVDVVLTHTCPLKYEPIEVFLSCIDQSSVDKSTEKWLDSIEDRIQYSKWYCGHFHTTKKIDKLQFMYEDIDVLSVT